MNKGKDVYTEIKNKMNELGLNQSQFAKKYNINVSCFCAFMSKYRKFSYRTIAILLEVIPTLTFEDFEEANKNVDLAQKNGL